MCYWMRRRSNALPRTETEHCTAVKIYQQKHVFYLRNIYLFKWIFLVLYVVVKQPWQRITSTAALAHCIIPHTQLGLCVGLPASYLLLLVQFTQYNAQLPAGATCSFSTQGKSWWSSAVGNTPTRDKCLIQHHMKRPHLSPLKSPHGGVRGKKAWESAKSVGFIHWGTFQDNASNSFSVISVWTEVLGWPTDQLKDIDIHKRTPLIWLKRGMHELKMTIIVSRSCTPQNIRLVHACRSH